MLQRTEQDVLDFLRDMSAPIGPWEFAGYGSELTQKITNISGDSEHYLDERDRILQEWIQFSDSVSLLNQVLTIATSDHLPEDYEIHRQRYNDGWIVTLTDLLDALIQDSNRVEILNCLEVHRPSSEIWRALSE